MNKATKFSFLVLILIFAYSCKNTKKYHSVELNLEKGTESVIKKAKNGESIEIKFYINNLPNISEDYVLEIPYNLAFEAYQNNVLLANFNKGDIRNTEANFVENKYPIITYYKNQLFLLNKIPKDNTPLVFKITKDKNTIENIKKIKLWNLEYINKLLDWDNSEDKTKIEQKYKYFEESKLPILRITIDTCISENKVFADYELVNNVESKQNSINDNPEVNGKIKIKLRGQTSKSFPKQSYSITTYSNKDKKKNIALLGMPKEHDWVLYGPYVDLSLMRNVISYELYRQMGHYSPRTEFCELIINNDYRGVYVLTEKIKRDKNRVNIKKYNSKTAKEFIVKIDKGEGDIWKSPYKSKVDSGWSKWLYYVYPKYNKMNLEQQEYIKGYVNKFETDVLENEDWKETINMQSFVDFLIINELTKNIDGYRLSTYLFRDSTKKLNIGPVWDFNFSLGQTQHREGYKPSGLIYKAEAIPFWWEMFMNDEKFKTQLRDRWSFLRKSEITEENINEIINKNSKHLSSSVERNNIKWNVLGSSNEFRYNNSETHEEELQYLQTWIKKRIKYLDEVILVNN